MTGSTPVGRPPAVAAITAERVIAAPRERVFRFLADLGCHWRLSDDAIELRQVQTGADGARGVIELRPPLPVERRAVTELRGLRDGAIVAGRARIGTRTWADVTWNLHSRERSTIVSLTAVVRRAALFDRLLLRLGGAWWLRRRFYTVLERLDHQLVRPPPQ
jgi:hypothetical protein